MQPLEYDQIESGCLVGRFEIPACAGMTKMGILQRSPERGERDPGLFNDFLSSVGCLVEGFSQALGGVWELFCGWPAIGEAQ